MVALELSLSESQSRTLTQAAARASETVEHFIVEAALQVASKATPVKANASREEVLALIAEVQRAYRQANPDETGALDQFLAERRAEADRE